jgi:hypothetical protein
MCKKASPEPSESEVKPKPFSGLNHETVASTAGPDGAGLSYGEGPPTGRAGRSRGISNCGITSSSNPPRRRDGRKSLPLPILSSHLRHRGPDRTPGGAVCPTSSNRNSSLARHRRGRRDDAPSQAEGHFQATSRKRSARIPLSHSGAFKMPEMGLAGHPKHFFCLKTCTLRTQCAFWREGEQE